MKKIKNIFAIIKGFFHFIDWKWYLIMMLIFTIAGMLDTTTTIYWYACLWICSFLLVIIAYIRDLLSKKISNQNKK